MKNVSRKKVSNNERHKRREKAFSFPMSSICAFSCEVNYTEKQFTPCFKLCIY